MKRLLGRTALVTGASRGIGAAVALMMAEEGADVAVNFRSKGTRAEEIADQVRAQGRRALLVQADLTDPSGVRAMAGAIEGAFGEVTDLVLNASGGLQPTKISRRAKRPARMPCVREFQNSMRTASGSRS